MCFFNVRNKPAIIICLLACFGVSLILSFNSASAFDFISQSGIGQTAKGTGHDRITTITADKPAAIFGKLVGIFLTFLGVIFLLLMIYGGYIWMMAAGNETQISKAKSIIKRSIFGLIVVLSAYAITSFVYYSLIQPPL